MGLPTQSVTIKNPFLATMNLAVGFMALVYMCHSIFHEQAYLEFDDTEVVRARDASRSVWPC
jgi:hypothetical protein